PDCMHRHGRAERRPRPPRGGAAPPHRLGRGEPGPHRVAARAAAAGVVPRDATAAVSRSRTQRATLDRILRAVHPADSLPPAALAGAVPLNGKAVQAYFDVRNRTETALTRLATLLAAVTHRFAYPLKQRAGLNVPLVGNGLCIGTTALREHGWMAFSIAEDWEMYARLTARGVAIEGMPIAVVYAQEARTMRQR